MGEQVSKRYLLFAGVQYYPQGGTEDFCGDFDSIDAAKQWFEQNHRSQGLDWADVMDKESLQSVAYARVNHSLFSGQESTLNWYASSSSAL